MRPDHDPPIAILLATRNGGPHLQTQLDSLSGQRHRNWRLIASDDGSTDDTVQILRDFAGRNPGRVAVVDGPRQGAAANFLSLLAHTRPGEWMAWCDQDDAWLPDRLSRGAAALADCPGGGVHACRTTICDAALRPLGPAPLYRRPPGFRNALVQACLPGNTTLANAKATGLLRRAAPAAMDAGIVSHDWWTYLLLAGAGARVIRDPAQTVLYRQHRGNVMGRNDTLRARAARLALLGSGDYGGWLRANLRALDGARTLLTEENARRLDAFRAAIDAPGPSAAWRLMRLGVYRQTAPGTAALLTAAAAGRLRQA